MTVLLGDCLHVLPTLEAESVDAIVTDPPYGLGFMGKEWDHGVPGVPFWEAALRVAKPGAHLVAFGGTRTYHRLTCAIEDAGWEIRDCLMWLYGSGFPKSLNVSKAIDAAAGAERSVIGRKNVGLGNGRGEGFNHNGWVAGVAVTEPATEAARQWDGWGTSLKPAWEPIILARKPFAATVAENVQLHGTSALNISACRIAVEDAAYARNHSGDRGHSGTRLTTEQRSTDLRAGGGQASDLGRWPANVVLDEEAAELLDDQTGELTSGANPTRRGSNKFASTYGDFAGQRECVPARGLDRGGASRFFYCAKASRSERDAGLYDERGQHRQPHGMSNGAKAAIARGEQYEAAGMGVNSTQMVRNNHPTVKPISLMRWVARLVTPPGGRILDMFCGSGTTGCAAAMESFDFLGIEREAEYVAIAEARIAHAISAHEPSLFEVAGT